MTIEFPGGEQGAPVEVEYSDTPAPVAPAPAQIAPEGAPAPTPAAPAPVQTTEPESGAGETPAGEPPAKLYEYAGRQLTAEELHKEVTEHLLPDYTKKSQIAARVGKNGDITNTPEVHKPIAPLSDDDQQYWEKPDWQPQDYAEIVKVSALAQETYARRAAATRESALAATTAANDAIVADLKKSDPNLNETMLYEHAEKYGFTDLRSAYSNLTDHTKALTSARESAAKAVKERQADPIAGKSGVPTDDGDGYDPSAISPGETALDVLRRNKAK